MGCSQRGTASRVFSRWSGQHANGHSMYAWCASWLSGVGWRCRERADGGPCPEGPGGDWDDTTTTNVEQGAGSSCGRCDSSTSEGRPVDRVDEPPGCNPTDADLGLDLWRFPRQ
nr:hypothetical protein CFP56_50325 [Quercus suber]